MAYEAERKAVRLSLLPDEHKRVRLAAAAVGVSMAEFCRCAAVDAAGKVKIEAPEAQKGAAIGARKSRRSK